MGTPSRRKDTIGLKFSDPVEINEICDVLFDRLNIDYEDIYGFQQHKFNKVEVKFKDSDVHKQFCIDYAEKELVLDDNKTVMVVNLSGIYTYVSIKFAPFDLTDATLINIMSRYGKVENIRWNKYTYGDARGLLNGTRTAKMILKTNIPSSMTVCDHNIVFMYQGQTRTCFKCGHVGHNASGCQNTAARINVYNLESFPTLMNSNNNENENEGTVNDMGNDENNSGDTREEIDVDSSIENDRITDNRSEMNDEIGETQIENAIPNESETDANIEGGEDASILKINDTNSKKNDEGNKDNISNQIDQIVNNGKTETSSTKINDISNKTVSCKEKQNKHNSDANTAIEPLISLENKLVKTNICNSAGSVKKNQTAHTGETKIINSAVKLKHPQIKHTGETETKILEDLNISNWAEVDLNKGNWWSDVLKSTPTKNKCKMRETDMIPSEVSENKQMNLRDRKQGKLSNKTN